MRLILVNPHVFAYGKTVSSFIFRRKMFLKYAFFKELYLNDTKKDVAFYIDGTYTSFDINWPFLPRVLAYLELFLWMIINKINPFRFKVYFNLKRLNPKNDVIFTFSRSFANVSPKNKRRLKLHEYKGLVFIHFTHYFQKIKKVSEYLMTFSHPVIVAESDLSTNAFFRKYFPFTQKVYQLPYSYADRFILKNNDFNSRIKKCIALGTMCPVDDKEFYSFFGKNETLHPMRKKLYEKHRDFPKQIDSFIKEFKGIENLKKINPQDTFIVKIIKKVSPYLILEKIFPPPQKQYFKFDIVQKYNEYAMFICPEEVIGLPSVNVFEGMACGCAYIGTNSLIYNNLGVEPGIHYIAYRENDLDDLISKIKYYQSHLKELKKISEQGYNFVKNNINRQITAKKFWHDLSVISNDFSRENKVRLTCSFNKNSLQNNAEIIN